MIYMIFPGKNNALVCSLFLQAGLFGAGIAYTITAATSLRYVKVIVTPHSAYTIISLKFYVILNVLLPLDAEQFRVQTP